MNRVKAYVSGKRSKKKIGVAPSIVLISPKYGYNVGAAIRAASCYGFKQVWFTGDRVELDERGKERLPREERTKGYRDVEVIQHDYPLSQFEDATPVAVEVRPNSEPLFAFEHPKNPVYVFGPEDGSIPDGIIHLCHRFVVIPTRHCLNLGNAVGTMLYDRQAKLYAKGEAELVTPGEWEGRGGGEALAHFFD